MKRSEFIKIVSEKSRYNQTVVKEVLSAVKDVVFDEVKNGGEVKLFDSVAICGKVIAEHNRRNPKTGEIVKCPKHMAPRAKFGSAIKAYVYD